MPQRADQVASNIKRSVQTVLARGLNDPRVRGLVSVTKVTVDDGFSQATVHVSVLPAEHAELAVHGLQHAAARIRAAIAGSVRLRRVPSLAFRLDETLKNQARFEAALAEGRRDQKDGEPLSPPPEPA